MAVGFRDYFEVLGVPRGASDEEIRSAYRKLAREYHPDVNKDPGAEDRFKEVSEAYEVLRDPEKRERYERLGANWKAGEDVSGASGFGGGGASSGFGGGDGQGFGDGAGFSDFFESFFGGRRGASGGFEGFSMRGGDQEATIEVTLEEAARGGKQKISLADGRDFEVQIPAGVRDGQKIRLAGQGGEGASGGPAGDLYLRVRIKRHPRFRREDDDLVVEIPVAPWEAALGATVPVPTLDGSAKVKVPAGSSSGRRLRLRGEGMPGPRGRKGDLYASVRVVVPKTLEKHERELFEELAAVSRFDPRQGR
ncbi:MAG TPA: DnaJ C-terminal domain-containing protein [Solirubrobacterales bacterium]|nr:DnaJ C-terminal domain-containing protein [Solirubrobacterales bacterium]